MAYINNVTRKRISDIDYEYLSFIDKDLYSYCSDNDSSFLDSAIIGAVTDSALIGGLLGGDLLGGILGDSLDGDLSD